MKQPLVLHTEVGTGTWRARFIARVNLRIRGQCCIFEVVGIGRVLIRSCDIWGYATNNLMAKYYVNLTFEPVKTMLGGRVKADRLVRIDVVVSPLPN